MIKVDTDSRRMSKSSNEVGTNFPFVSLPRPNLQMAARLKPACVSSDTAATLFNPVVWFARLATFPTFTLPQPIDYDHPYAIQSVYEVPAGGQRDLNSFSNMNDFFMQGPDARRANSRRSFKT